MIARRKDGVGGVFTFKHSRRMRHTNEKHRVLVSFGRSVVDGASGMLLEHIVVVLHARDLAFANGVDAFIHPVYGRSVIVTIVAKFAGILDMHYGHTTLVI